MFRFLRITLILWLLSVALIGGAALYGRTHAAPNELQALGFDVCEGRPCWRKIIPGVTSWDTAMPIMVSSGLKPSISGPDGQDKMQLDPNGTSDLSINILKNYREPLVDWVELTDYRLDKGVSLAELIYLFGKPCNVQRDSISYWLSYPFGLARVTVNDHFDLDSRVQYIIIVNPAEVNGVSGIAICGIFAPEQFTSSPWLGFASVERYKAHGLKRYDD